MDWLSHPVLGGFAGSLAAGLATGLGALPILVKGDWSSRAQRLMLASAGGVMLAAVFFSLLSPAVALAEAQTGSNLAGATVIAAGMIGGALLVWGLHQGLPHEHFAKGKEGASVDVARHWMLVFAIAIHNLPEGMSVGVAVGGDARTGFAVMLGIGLQNVPEGLAVAAALVADGQKRRTAFWLALGTGLLEPMGGLIGAAFVASSQALLPYALAGAAGAMLFVILSEIVPETCHDGHEHEATAGALCGFAIMMLLDAVFA